MKIFRINFSAERALIGREFPQIQKANYSVHFDLPNFFKNTPLFGPDLESIIFPTFILEKSAKPSDLLSAAGISQHQIVSAKFVDLINQVNSDDFEKHPINVEHKKEILDYFAIRIPETRNDDYIDWRNCTFHVLDVQEEIIGETRFQNFDEYRQRMRSIYFENGGKFKAKEIVWLFDKIESDFFKMLLVVPGYYVSEKFVQLAKEQKLTGIQFEPIN